MTAGTTADRRASRLPAAPPTRARAGSVLAAALCVLLLVSGCVGSSDGAEPEPSEQPGPAASASPSAAPEAPELVPGGSAEENLPYFDSVNSALLGATPMPGGRPIIDNLVAAGFDRAAMQVTLDTTAIGGEVDAVQFSVRFGEECLVGQASESGYTGAIGPVVGENCLLGQTRPIDW